MTVFERIKELADKQGKSLQKVSEDLGLSTNYIYNLKGDKSPAADKLALIADYFHVSVYYLLGRENKNFSSHAPRKHRKVKTKIKYTNVTNKLIYILGIKK